MNENVDIYVCCHKKPNVYPKNKVYTLISSNIFDDITDVKQIKEGAEDSLLCMQKSYGECSRIYWVWKHEQLKDYIGFCHYSRVFDFIDDVPDINEIFTKYDIIVPKPIYNRTWHPEADSNIAVVRQDHNIQDLSDIIKICLKKYPEYKQDWEEFLTRNNCYYNNIFIMKKEDFNKYCEFAFSIMDEFNKLHKFTTQKNIRQYVIKCYHNNMYSKTAKFISWQERLHGFYMEYLTDIYIRHNFTKEKRYEIKVDNIKIKQLNDLDNIKNKKRDSAK